MIHHPAPEVTRAAGIIRHNGEYIKKTTWEANTMQKLYNVSLANKTSIFDEAKGLADATALHSFVSGHGGVYTVHIDIGNGANGEAVSVSYHDAKGVYHYIGPWGEEEWFAPSGLQKFLDTHF